MASAPQLSPIDKALGGKASVPPRSSSPVAGGAADRAERPHDPQPAWATTASGAGKPVAVDTAKWAAGIKPE